MELAREDILPNIQPLLDLLVDKPDRKLVLKLGRFLSGEEVDVIWREICSMENVTEIIDEERLDVIQTQTGNCIVIEGISNISKFCTTESVYGIPYRCERKETVGTRTFAKEFAEKLHLEVIELNARTEQNVDRETEDAVAMEVENDSQKIYELRKVFRYQLPSKIQFLIQHVRQSTDPVSSMRRSNVTNTPVEYFITIEFPVEAVTADTVTDTMILFLQYVTNDMFPMSKQQQEDVLQGYNMLVDKLITVPSRKEKEPFFFAPKPMTLERIHLQDPYDEKADHAAYGITTIQTGYAVTPKADGERMLLYIYNDGKLYRINNTLQVRWTGWTTTAERLRNTLIDGEWVSYAQRKHPNTRDLFLGFDIYMVGNVPVTQLPLLSIGSSQTTKRDHRMGKLEAVMDPDLWTSANERYVVELQIKEHRAAEGSDIFRVCRDILEDVSADYEIDGLIFTPHEIPVLGYYPKEPVDIGTNMSWTKVLKWKPSDQNTIDFLIKETTSAFQDPTTGNVYRIFKLYTGYNRLQWEDISPLEGLRLRYDRAYRQTKMANADVYTAHEFDPISYKQSRVSEVWLPLEGNMPTAPNGDIIRNESIVEFAYEKDSTKPVYMRWKPLRVREDKTRKYKESKSLSKTANDYSVAMNIWRSIHEPVSQAMMMGQEAIPKLTGVDGVLGVDDMYYARDIPRYHMLSKHMLNFHNLGIKNKIYGKAPRGGSLLELACGKAGDLPRWSSQQLSFVLGIDLVRNNITHPRDGSWARMLNPRTGYAGRMQAEMRTVFVVGDCAENIKDGSAARKIDDRESEDILSYVYGRKRSMKNQSYIRAIEGKAAGGFDIVSCQFAIHYFFESEGSLHGFLRNVSENLKRGGLFITTFMDGQKVHQMFKEKNTSLVEGRKVDDRIPVWAILKKYKEFDIDNQEIYGKPIDVFLENTNRLITEFLVDIGTLKEMAKQHQLEVDDEGSFQDTFMKLAKDSQTIQQTALREAIQALKKDHVQAEFSFLNHWMIFRKV